MGGRKGEVFKQAVRAAHTRAKIQLRDHMRFPRLVRIFQKQQHAETHTLCIYSSEGICRVAIAEEPSVGLSVSFVLATVSPRHPHTLETQ